MGSGFKQFEVGEVLGAADVMNYLMKQVIATFTDSSARDSAITAPEEGQAMFGKFADILWLYTGSKWREALYLSGWQPYTPVWTGDSSNPTLGNGTANGRYARMGNMVVFNAEVTIGSTTVQGNGAYSLSLPVKPKITAPTQYVQSRVSDSSSGQAYAGQSGALVETSVQLLVQGTADLDTVTKTAPVTLAVGDALHAWGTYEAADDT